MPMRDTQNNRGSAPASAGQHLLSPAARKSMSTMLNGTLRVTVRTMLRQGLSVEDVATALEVPQELIQTEADKLEVSKTGPGPAESSISAGSESNTGPDPEHIRVAETGLGKLQPRALEVVEELLEYADSSTVRMSAARMILEGANGSLRPKQVQTGNNFTAIQFLFQDAQKTYAEQLRLAGVEPKGSAPVDVEAIVSASEPKA